MSTLAKKYSDSEIYASVETITPAKAKDMLERMRSNRSVKETKVRQYAYAMERGQWSVGDPISIDRNGYLSNGQHRLLAVIKCDKAIDFLVTRGLDPESVKHHDIGIQRSAADVLMMHDIKNAAVQAAIARCCIAMENGAAHPLKSHQMPNPPSIDDILERVQKDPLINVLGREMSGRFKPFGRLLKTAGGAGWFIYCLYNGCDDQELVEDFIDVVKGIKIGSSDDDPAFTLHQRLVRNENMSAKTPNTIRLPLAVKAWNAYYVGDTLNRRQLVFRAVGRAAESFPSVALDRPVAAAGYD